MKTLALLLSAALALAACGKVEPLRRVAEAPQGKSVARAQTVSEIPPPGPEARPEVRHPFLEPQSPREDDRFDLPPTSR